MTAGRFARIVLLKSNLNVGMLGPIALCAACRLGKENTMSKDYVHPLRVLRAVMVQKRRTLAESLLHTRKRGKAAKQREKLIKLQKEIDVIDDAIADEQLLSPSLREQLAKEPTGEDEVTTRVDPTAEPMERVKARLTELSERLTEGRSAKVSTPGAK
jgi:hypothetical protein